MIEQELFFVCGNVRVSVAFHVYMQGVSLFKKVTLEQYVCVTMYTL